MTKVRRRNSPSIVKLAKLLRQIGFAGLAKAGAQPNWTPWKSLKPASKAGWIAIAKYVKEKYD